MKNKNRKKLTWTLSLLLAAILLLSGCGGTTGGFGGKEAEQEVMKATPVYLASKDLTVPVYQYVTSTNEQKEEIRTFEKAEDLVRGTEVYSHEKTINAGTEEEPEEYLEILLEKPKEEKALTYYYVKPENVAEDPEKVVQETEKYVRTSATVYEKETGAGIASFVKKGSRLEITGYTGMNDDGSVAKYQVTVPESGTQGWVYAKYLTDSQEDADAVYSSVANIHKDRIYKDLDLQGGLPSTLDWYPFERTAIDGNTLCEEARTMYLCAEAAVNNASYLQLIKDHGINAVVIDIKDGQLAYESEVARELSPTSYDHAFTSIEEYQQAVAAFREAGVYTIGRIVCFNDEYYAADHPETCIDSPSSYQAWPSAYSRDAWYYNVELALEAVNLCGFHEIQFDYVRFPENAYGLSSDPETDFKNAYDEEKAEAIQNFCFYATDTIHEAGAYFSVDVFGECADEYVSAYGQYWPAISNIVDAISGMPYTDHYGADVDRWTYPYEIVYTFAERAAKRQKEIETPAIVRTWITGYDTPNWDPTVDYDEEKMTDQINALYDAGLTGGFIPWNGGSSIFKYQEYAGIWDNTYTPDAARTENVTKPEEETTRETETAAEAETTAAEEYYEYEEPVQEEYDEEIPEDSYEEPVWDENAENY